MDQNIIIPNGITYCIHKTSNTNLIPLLSKLKINQFIYFRLKFLKILQECDVVQIIALGF